VEVLAEFVDRREGAHACTADELIRPLQKQRELVAVQQDRQLMGGARLFRRRERHPVPGGVVRPEAELAQARGGGEGGCGGLPPLGERLQRDGIQAGGGGRRRILRRQLGEGAQRLERR